MKYGDLKVGDIVVTKCNITYHRECPKCKRFVLYETKKVLKTVAQLEVIFDPCPVGGMSDLGLKFSKDNRGNIYGLVGII